MVDSLTALERPAGVDWPRLLCVAMFGAPVLLAFVVTAIVRAAGAPAGAGDFQPANVTALSCVLGAAVYAIVFMRVLNGVRLRLQSDFSAGLRASAVSVGSVWGLGLGLWAMTSIFVVLFVCGPINRAIGQVSVEPWRVWGKETPTGKGCHFRLAVMSRTSLDAGRVCVSRERWEQVQLEDSVTMKTIASPLGVQRGLACEACGKEPVR